MLTYHYIARNPSTGKQVKADVQADSEGAAAKLISQEGLVPIDIRVGEKGLGGIRGKFGNKVKARDRVLFSRQLSTLINAGLPLMQALRSVNQQTVSKPLKLTISEVIGDIEAGTTFSAALAKHPRVFNQVYVSLIAAGETSGTLDASLERLAIQQEKDADLNSKIRGALTYPIIVLLVMGGVIGFMVVKVLPQVKTIYASLPGGTSTLPFSTKALLALSDFIIHKWWIVVIIVGILVVVISRWSRTTSGKSVMDRAKMSAWPIGKLFMKMYMARFARTGTTLVASGVPLLQMLDITGNAVNNVHIKSSISRAIDKIKGGKSLADSLEGDKSFLPLVPNMIRIGEQSGAIEQMMGKVADYYEKEVDNEVAAISSIIEPVMMVVLGIVAFIIVGAVLLPIYGLTNNSGFTGG
jgi:type IV pilus assembly protein PilC